jgi:hypothetical protein
VSHAKPKPLFAPFHDRLREFLDLSTKLHQFRLTVCRKRLRELIYLLTKFRHIRMTVFLVPLREHFDMSTMVDQISLAVIREGSCERFDLPTKIHQILMDVERISANLLASPVDSLRNRIELSRKYEETSQRRTTKNIGALGGAVGSHVIGFGSINDGLDLTFCTHDHSLGTSAKRCFEERPQA